MIDATLWVLYKKNLRYGFYHDDCTNTLPQYSLPYPALWLCGFDE